MTMGQLTMHAMQAVGLWIALPAWQCCRLPPKKQIHKQVIQQPPASLPIFHTIPPLPLLHHDRPRVSHTVKLPEARRMARTRGLAVTQASPTTARPASSSLASGLTLPRASVAFQDARWEPVPASQTHTLPSRLPDARRRGGRKPSGSGRSGCLFRGNPRGRV